MPFDLAASQARRAQCAAATQQLAGSAHSPADFLAAKARIEQAKQEHAAACDQQEYNLSRIQRTK